MRERFKRFKKKIFMKNKVAVIFSKFQKFLILNQTIQYSNIN